MGSVKQMLMLVTKLFLLLNLVVDVYPMTEEELKIIIHLHQEDGGAVDESGTDYILDHKNQAAADGINSSPYGSSWTTRPDSPCIEKDMSYDGPDLHMVWEISAEACACACQDYEDCSFFTWNGSLCVMLSSDKGKKKYRSGSFSGSRHCCKNRDSPCIEKDMSYDGHDLRLTWEASAEECACACQDDDRCGFFTWDRKDRNRHMMKCHLKTSIGKKKYKSGSYSGSVNCCKNRDECGDDNFPCENCGYYDCKESEKCKWSSGSGNGKWTPHGPYGVCKPRDEDKCGDNNLPCEDCGYYDCQESDKCKWSSGSGNHKWSPQGPYGVCESRERSIGSCNWSRDCQSYQSCKYIYDASCVCLFGQCVVKPIPFMGIGTQCRQYTDCDCRDTPEFCFCKHGTCEKTRWECHEKRDCARLSKCRNKDCVCSGNLCEHHCDRDRDCKDFHCNTALGTTCKCENSFCAYKQKPKECRTIGDCVYQGLCQADKPCACTQDYCTLPWWVQDKNTKKHCRSDQECEEIILDCAGGKCSCLDMVPVKYKRSRGTCVANKTWRSK